MHLNDLESRTLQELRDQWSLAWGKQPHGLMGRTMIIESLKFKQWQNKTGGLKPEQQSRLNELVKSYKRNPNTFDASIQLRPGTRLVRSWKGKKYSVNITKDGFEYNGSVYSSLSQVANTITGSRWNGWAFFGLKK